jgi:hypothetical protein
MIADNQTFKEMESWSMTEQWVPMSEAAFILKSEGFDVSPSKLTRLANRKAIRTEKDPLDERVRLVDINELRQMFSASKRYRG